MESAPLDDPEIAASYRESGTRALLAAPTTAGCQRLGVLVAYAPYPPRFADDDLVLMRLLGDQAAVILERRKLIDSAARTRAREEATRLRDNVLRSAAHDLNTPGLACTSAAPSWRRTAGRAP